MEKMKSNKSEYIRNLPVFLLLCFILFSPACANNKRNNEVPTISENMVEPQKNNNVTGIIKDLSEDKDENEQMEMYNQCNAASGSNWPIMENDEAFYYKKIDRQGEAWTLEKKNKSSSEVTCLSDDEENFDELAMLYENQIIYFNKEQNENMFSLNLYTRSISDNSVSHICKLDEFEENKIYGTELLVYQEKAVVIYRKGRIFPGEKATYICSLVDFQTKSNKNIYEGTFTYNEGEVSQLSAYHDTVFFVKKEKTKSCLFRYDLKNNCIVDSKNLPIERNYALLDEERVLYTKDGDLMLYDFETDTISKISVELPYPFQSGNDMGGKLRNAYG